MSKRFRYLLCCTILCVMCTSAWADGRVDSLRARANDTSLHDTIRIATFWSLSVRKQLSDEESLAILEKTEEMCKAQPSYKWLANNHRQRATLFYFRGKLPQAVIEIQAAMDIAKANNDDRLIADMLKNLGVLQRRMDQYVDATKTLLEAEKLYIKIGDTSGLAGAYNNLGNLYENRQDYDLAEKYLLQSVELNKNDSGALAANYLNLGNVVSARGNLDKAMSYYQQSARIRAVKDVDKASALWHNIGSLYFDMHKYDSARYYLDSAYHVRVENHDDYGLAGSYIALAELEDALENHERVLELATEALTLSRANSDLSRAKEACLLLQLAHSKMGDFEQAYHWSLQKQAYGDSVFNREKIQAFTRADMQHDFEKIQLADSLKTAKDKEIAAAELASANTQKYALYGGLGAVLVLVAIVYRGYRRKKSDNELITEQKELVEEKNKEIVDSINYAKRLQDAILPSRKFVAEHLPDSFILYLPKDIVAGDFYWMEVVDNTIYIAAADCTGHGVPGAMVSVVCSNALNKAVVEMGIINPGQILDKVRELVTQHFDKGEDEVKDGMDISFCAIDKQMKSMKWAGAFNPLWVIRDGKLMEYKADKQAIGKVDAPTPFKTHEIELQANDTFYIFSDGYADQFGGEKGKKLKSANLKKKLLELQDQNMHQQADSLNRAFAKWKGDLEQLDDVCVIGVRV